MTDSSSSRVGQVRAVAADGTELHVRTEAGVVRVAFDNLLSSSLPHLNDPVTLHWAGWRFGIPPSALWGIRETPHVVLQALPERPTLFGFRNGCRRHAKYVVHELNLPRDGSRVAPLPASATSLPSACPATATGIENCYSERGRCSPAAFWQTEALLASASLAYEEEALSLATRSDTIAVLAEGTLSPDLGDRSHDARTFRLLLLASGEGGRFLYAANPSNDDQRYSLLTFYTPDSSVTEEIRRRLVNKNILHIRRAHVPATLPEAVRQALGKWPLSLVLATRATHSLRPGSVPRSA